jgi:hypothetical protein
MNKIESIDGIGEYVPGVSTRANANNIDTQCLPAIYVVHAKRWGEDEGHSYIVVATTREIDAFAAAEFSEYQRGGKYGCEVSCFNNGEKNIIRKPYDGKPNCYSCEHSRERTGLICQNCKSFSNWSKKT